jgi:hypothetical protein
MVHPPDQGVRQLDRPQLEKSLRMAYFSIQKIASFGLAIPIHPSDRDALAVW